MYESGPTCVPVLCGRVAPLAQLERRRSRVSSAEFQSVAFCTEKAPGSLVRLCGSSSARSFWLLIFLKTRTCGQFHDVYFTPIKTDNTNGMNTCLLRTSALTAFLSVPVSLLWVLSYFEPLAGKQAVCLAWWTKLVGPPSLRCCCA